MWKSLSNKPSLPPSWKVIESIEDLNAAVKDSSMHPIILFKHSTRCSISSFAKRRLESESSASPLTIYYLDLLAHRNVSNEIANRFRVAHQSPQIILLKNGKAIFNASHERVGLEEVSLLVS